MDPAPEGRTEDQNTANRLLQKMLEDGSPFVRKELVVTMQHVVNSFPNNFMSLMKAIAEEDECLCWHKLHNVGEGWQHDQGQQ